MFCMAQLASSGTRARLGAGGRTDGGGDGGGDADSDSFARAGVVEVPGCTDGVSGAISEPPEIAVDGAAGRVGVGGTVCKVVPGVAAGSTGVTVPAAGGAGTAGTAGGSSPTGMAGTTGPEPV